jgi:hypothetical protein
MFTPTGLLHPPIEPPRAVLRPRAWIGLRSLLTAGLVLLALGGLSATVGAAYAAGAPTVSKIKPNTGPGTGGTSVNISGTGFTGATVVRFGSTEAASFVVNSSTSIKAKSPAGGGVVDVTVTAGGETSATGPNDRFTYLPAVTAVSPNRGGVEGGTTVTITGVDFSEATAVDFGSTAAASFTVDSSTSITAESPAEAVGRVHVRVTTPDGTSPISPGKDIFTFTPTVTNVSPATGPPAGGTTVTVTGTGFAVGETETIITFGASGRARSASCPTTTECVATAPPLQAGEEYVNPVDVRATTNRIVSPKTPGDQFHYHGLYLKSRRHRIHVGAELVGLRGEVFGSQTSGCSAFLDGHVAANGEATDEIDIGVAQFSSCLPSEWSGGLPFSFALRLGDDGSASIETPMDLHTGFGCVYEGNKLSGGFQIGGFPFAVSLGGTFTLVAEEEPGAECSETESVFMSVGDSQEPETELVQ